MVKKDNFFNLNIVKEDFFGTAVSGAKKSFREKVLGEKDEFLLALDWLASEHKYAVELKEDLKAISKEKNAGKLKKEIRRAVLVLNYIGRSERRANGYEERVKKKLSDVLGFLERKGINISSKVEWIEEFRKVISEINVESNKLISYASQYSGLLAQDLHDFEAVAVLEAKAQVKANLKEEGKKLEIDRLEVKFQDLVDKILHDISDFDKWISALVVSLEKAKGLIEKYHGKRKGDRNLIIQEGMAILSKNGFLINKYSDEALFLAQYPSELREIVRLLDNYTGLVFKFGLIQVFPFLKSGEVSWKRVISLVEESGHDVNLIFIYGFDRLRPLIEAKILSFDKGISDILKMCRAARDNSSNMINHGISNAVPYVLKGNLSWEQVVKDFPKMASSCKGDSEEMFGSGFNSAFEFVLEGKLTWNKLVEDLPKLILKSGRGYVRNVYVGGLREVLKLIEAKKISWDEGISGLVRMARFGGTGLTYMYGYSIKYCTPLIISGKLKWGEVVEGLPKISEALGDYHFNSDKFIVTVKPFLNSSNWDDLVKFLCVVAKSKQKTEKFLKFRGFFDEKSGIFFVYLIRTKPKIALKVLDRFLLLNRLGINFDKEMDLLLKIAGPLNLVSNDFAKLNLITTPIAELDAGRKRRFLKLLDEGLQVFQGMNYSFMKSFKLSLDEFGPSAKGKFKGLRDVDSYSFVQLVYVYLKLLEDPEIKFKRLGNGLLKIRKFEKKARMYTLGNESMEDLSEIRRKGLIKSLRNVSLIFFDSVKYMYEDVSKDRIEGYLAALFKVEIKDYADKIANPSLMNALLMYKKLEETKRYTDPLKSSLVKYLFLLIQNYLSGKVYPLKKAKLKYFPWNLKENLAWLKINLRGKGKYWIKDFRKTYWVRKSDLEDSNAESRIEHHLNDAARIIGKIGLSVHENSEEFSDAAGGSIHEVNVANVKAIYKKVASSSRYDKGLVSDLKTQVDALQSLEGGVKARAGVLGRRIIISPEFDTLEVLQMGNYVQGSCLALDGVNYGSTIVNAVEVNKRILWAKDGSGKIIGRVLIAVDSSKRIVYFPIYYATNMKLDRFFEAYVKELAKRCGFGINGNADKVKHLLVGDWYTDDVVELEE